MANLRGVGGMKQRNLIASFADAQVTKKDGKVTGAYLTVELDQSTMTQKDAKAGKADTNPYIESHAAKGKDGQEFVSHNVWYSQSQIDAMQNAGKSVVQSDGRTAIAFKADVQKSKDGKTGETRMIVLTPKDPAKAKDAEERAKIEKYNEMHPIGASDNTKFGKDSLAKQEKITTLAKENRPAKEAPGAEMQAEQQAEAASPEMG